MLRRIFHHYLGIAGIVICFAFSPPVSANSGAIQNLAALVASEKICGFKIDQPMLELTIREVIGDPETVGPNGKHWPEIQKNIARLQPIIATDKGKQAFCDRIKNQLSAFLE